MEPVTFTYSTKHIPVASDKEYIKQFIDKTEQFLRRMRWKAFHFLKQEKSAAKETFGFKTKNCPPVIEELQNFEEGMTQIIQKVELRKINCQFQKDLRNDITSVKSNNRLFVKADKSTNFYKLDAAKYNQLLNDNITKAYKKSDGNQLKAIHTEAKAITKRLKIDDQVEITAQKETFRTLKHHKDNFLNKPTC